MCFLVNIFTLKQLELSFTVCYYRFKYKVTVAQVIQSDANLLSGKGSKIMSVPVQRSWWDSNYAIQNQELFSLEL